MIEFCIPVVSIVVLVQQWKLIFKGKLAHTLNGDTFT